MCAESAGRNGTTVISLGKLLLNLENFQTTVDGRRVALTYDEFELLSFMASQPDRVILYEAIARHLWDSSGRRPIRHLNVLVHRLRQKLGDIRPYEITTVRGRGYGLVYASGGQD